MYVDDPEDVVLNGLPVEEGRKSLESATVREIRATRSKAAKVKVKSFHSLEATSTVLSTRVPTETSEQIHVLARAKGLSISEYISKMIEETIQRDIIEDHSEIVEGEKEQ